MAPLGTPRSSGKGPRFIELPEPAVSTPLSVVVDVDRAVSNSHGNVAVITMHLDGPAVRQRDG